VVPLDLAAAALALAPIALLAMVGADARWLAALGGEISAHWQIPAGVPFAALPTSGWHNLPVLAELAFHGLERTGGERALLGAQLAACAAALWFVRRDIRAGGGNERQAALVLPLVVLTAAPAFLVVRVQLFSLALFPALLYLLRSEARTPSRRIWLVPPLLALWTNLHGAVLFGLAGFACYLLCERRRHSPRESLALTAAGVAALLATPALLQTPAYFRSVLGNEAARRGVGLWAPLSLSSGWGMLLTGGGLVLLVFALRARPRRFELLLLAGLAAMSIETSRSGVWFVLAAAVPAARALPRINPLERSWLALPLLALSLAAVGTSLFEGPDSAGAGGPLLARTLVLAHGHPVLADDALAEQVALAGGRIWAGDPIDAFAPAAQRAYIAWLRGEPGGDRLVARTRIALVVPGGASEQRLLRSGDFRLVARDRNASLYLRRRAAG
jgi:hypothetical protein